MANDLLHLLRRVKPEMVAGGDELDIELAEKAAKVLGYKPLLQVSSRAQLRHAVTTALVALGIDPWENASVEAYKCEVARRYNTWWRRWLNQGPHEWSFRTLQSYPELVKEFALSRALELAERVPEARFYVCEFGPIPDPFLVVSERIGDEWRERFHTLPWVVYLDVWDEPAFEGRRTA